MIQDEARDPAKMGRFHGLDACRAAAMLLGLFFHGAISFMHVRVPWAIRDRSTHLAVDAFVWVCHTFRMPVFFLLAGFFGRLLFVKLGPSGFLRHRAKRILLPFAVLVAPLVGTLYALWLWGISRGGPMGSVPFGMDPPGVDPDAILRSPGHLWFLYYLMILSAGMGLAAALAVRLPISGVLTGIDALLRSLVRLRVLPFAMAVPTAVTLHSMQVLAADTPVSFVPQFRILAYYSMFVGTGWLIHRQPALVDELAKALWIPLLTALAAIVPLGLLVDRTLQMGPIASVGLRVGALYLSALFGWSLVVLFIGAFVRWGARPRPWVSYLSDASYWSYLIHLPVVVALQILVADLAWPGPIKYLLVMAGTIAACLGSYQVFVRHTFVGAALNGPRARPTPVAVIP